MDAVTKDREEFVVMGRALGGASRTRRRRKRLPAPCSWTCVVRRAVVRRAGMFEQADALIVGAEWRDPAAATHWDEQVRVDRDVIVHCIYGHEVGRANRALEPKPAVVQ